MEPRNSANLSIVIVTPEHYDTIRETISCLRKQTVQDQLEVVIVAPSAEDLQLEEAELTGFFGFNVVEVGAIKSIASANAAGIRKATAPIVALGKDHAFPNRSWAEALIKAHRGEWAVVGPQVQNANPENAISWADYLMGYDHGWHRRQPARSIICRDITAATARYSAGVWRRTRIYARRGRCPTLGSTFQSSPAVPRAQSQHRSS